MSAFLGLILLIIPLWRICARAGYHPALSLICLIPFVGLLIVAVVLAFTEWPSAERRRIAYRGKP